MKDYTIVGFADGRANFSFEIKLSENRTIDKDTGYLYCDNSIFGHTGVQAYYGWEVNMKDKDVVRVHRFAEDIFTDEAMASIEGKSITMRHPDEPVNSKNYKAYDVGTILKVWRDGDNIMGKVVIKDMDAIEAILEERAESLSLGYKAKIVPIGDGSEYKQTDLHINHLAIVAVGRAKNARLSDEQPEKKGVKKMGLFDWLIGKRIKPNEDGSINILKDEDPVEIEDTKYKAERKTVTTEENTYDTETGETTTKVETTTECKETVEDEKKETKETPMNDEQIQALKDSVREEILAEIKKAKLEENPNVFKETQTLTPKIEDEDGTTVLRLDFQRDEKLKKIYYDKLTNPMAHGGDFKALEAFAKKATSMQVR